MMGDNLESRSTTRGFAQSLWQEMNYFVRECVFLFVRLYLCKIDVWKLYNMHVLHVHKSYINHVDE